MITEVAILYIKEKQSELFEHAFAEAQKVISSANGYIDHELLRCIEEKNKYVLTVKWKSIEDHTEGFRKSEEYNIWKNLLHHFYDPFPIVEHYQKLN